MIRARGSISPPCEFNALMCRSLPDLCFCVCSVLDHDELRYLCSVDSRPTACVELSKVTHSLTSLPTHTTAATLNHVLIAHVISMLARLRSHRLCRRRALSWMDRRLYGTEIQDWFSPPFGAVVVDGLSVGRWTPTRPPRTTCYTRWGPWWLLQA